MKLYNSIGPNPRLVRIYLAEKGIDVDLVDVDLMSGENRKAEYLERNPGGQLPALELDDGTVIAETIAICEYLEELNPEPPLIGSTPEERAITRMRVRQILLYIIEPLTAGFRAAEGAALFKDRMPIFPQVAIELKAAAQHGLGWLEPLLAGKEYVTGDRFTIADISLFAILEFGAMTGQAIDPAHKNIVAWYERVSKRPSIASK